MHAAPGVGLAAPQVGVERRVAVVDLSVGRDPDSVLVLVNPLIEGAEGVEVDTEGCLSIPDFTEKVPRPTRVAVSAADLTGERRSFVAEGFLARAICHEIDHLDGVLFVDHLRGLRKERAKRFLKKLAREQEPMPDPEGRESREQRKWDEASASR
jgi:peptide deformylase